METLGENAYFQRLKGVSQGAMGELPRATLGECSMGNEALPTYTLDVATMGTRGKSSVQIRIPAKAPVGHREDPLPYGGSGCVVRGDS